MNSVTDPQVKRSLRASINDGLSWSIMSGIGESYLNAYAVFLRAVPLQLGIIAALPSLAAALSQHTGVYLLERFKTRTKLLTVLVALHAALWIPVALLGILLAPSADNAWILLACLLLYFSVAGAAGPIWNSLMGDLVPASSRGQYFALRNRLVSAVTFIALIVGGYILQLWQRIGLEAWGFVVIFLIAATFRGICVHFIKMHYDPPFELQGTTKFGFIEFLRATPRSNFARFALFQGSINFGLQIAAPFFPLFMLKHLHFSYLEYTLQTSVMIMGQVLTFTHWGKLCDSFGTKRILNFCSVGICISPLIWVLPNDFYLLLVNHFFAGCFWAGFNLSIGNFLYDAVSPAKRARCAAYVAIINGICSIAGALLGGYLLTHGFFAELAFLLNPDFKVVFALSAGIRMAGAWYFLPRISEVRDVEKIATKDFIFRALSLKAFSEMPFSVISRKRLPHQKKQKKNDPTPPA